ncbi:ankyrin repeat domain-containing protein [Candidatus Babeliales bacterium]|nr:ankyrin repeat domain-containing protein [Candidatus Babeliales bacterium]
MKRIKQFFVCIMFGLFGVSAFCVVYKTKIADGDPDLVKAVKRNHIAQVRRLLEEGVNPDQLDKENYTALHWAASLGNIKAANIILDSVSDCFSFVDKRGGKRRFTSLMSAISNGQEEMVFLLLKNNADVKVAGDGKWTALHVAAAKGNVEIIKSLLKSGAKLNAKDKDLNTPLIIAAMNKRYGAMKVLLNPPYPCLKRVKINHKNCIYMTALDYAKEKEFENGMNLLLSYGAKNKYRFMDLVSDIKKLICWSKKMV